MEPGLVPGTWRVSFTTLYGSDFEGSHLSREGNTPDGLPVEVPLYRHDVALDYLRLELGLQYTFAPQWDVIARIPWEQKNQRAGAGLTENATAAERASMQRNIDIHHRSVTLRGAGDVMLLGRRRWYSVRRESDALSLAAGMTVPTGVTVENPYVLGKQNRRHIHIQFGSGTVDPLLEASYATPLTPWLEAGAYFNGRFPLYENRRTFRAPPDATIGIHTSMRATPRIRLRVEGAFFAQGYGYWDGLRDENTGLTGTSISAGASIRMPAFTVNVDVRRPLSQRTLDEGDAFKQGLTYIVSISRLIR